ncbi:LOW QUALITY PROTEIN: transcription factor 20 [Polyodon spathula]|uniref:LOW QUALITY PROTEIN: transcription factor 20 n=1 Tax=Polyodon spathula TaxID=7913 RepID=UPI001B7DAE87|nr:LOW QUALITY PROTEIN: transcription factor 20 [Polyodon spathula]
MMQTFREPQSTTNAPNATSVNSFPLTQAAVSGNSLYPSQQNSPRLVVEDCRGQPPPNHTQQHPSQIAPLSHSPHPSQASLLQGYASPRRPPLDYPSGLAYRKEMADYYYLSGGKEAQRRGVPFPYSSSHSHSPSSTSSSSSSSSSSSQSSAAAAGNLDGSRPYTHPHPQRHPGLYQPENFAGANSAVASAAYSPHYGMPAQQQQQVYSQPLQQSSAALPAGVLVHQRGRFQQQQQQQRLSQFGHYPHSPVLQSTGLAGPSPAASSYNPSQPQRYAGGPQQQPASGFDAYGKMKPGVYENSPQQVPCYPAGYGYRFQASQQQQQQLSKAYEQAKGGHSASLYPGGCGKLGNPPPALPFPSQEAASKSPVVTQQQFHQNFSPISNPSPPAAPPSSSSVAPSPTCSSTPSPLMGAPDSGGGTSQRNSRLLLQKSQVSPNHGSPGQQQQLQLLQHLPYKASPLDRLRQDKPSLDPGWSSLNALSSQVANIPNTVQHMLLSDALLSHHKRKELPPQPQPHHSVSLSGASPGSASAGRNRARKAGEAVGGGGGGGGAGGRSPVRPESRSGDLLQSPAPGSLESPGEEDPALSAAERAQRLSGQSNGSETDPCHPGAGPPRQAPPPLLLLFLLLALLYPPLVLPVLEVWKAAEEERGLGRHRRRDPPKTRGAKANQTPERWFCRPGKQLRRRLTFPVAPLGKRRQWCLLSLSLSTHLLLPLPPRPFRLLAPLLRALRVAPSLQGLGSRRQLLKPLKITAKAEIAATTTTLIISRAKDGATKPRRKPRCGRGQLEEEEEEEEEEESESPASRPRRSQPAGRKPDDDGGPAPSSPRPRSADTGGSIRVIVSARSEQAPQTREQNRTGSQEQDYHPRHNGQGAAHRQHHGPAPCPGYADDQPGHRQHHRPGKSVLETPGRQEERQRRQRPLQPQPQHFPSLLQEVLQGYHFLDRRYSQRPDQAAAPPNCAPSSARPPGTEHVPPGKYPVGGGRAEQVWGGGAAGGWGDKKGVLLPEQQDFPQRSVEQTSAAKHIDLADYSLIRKPLEREKGVGKATREPSAVKTPPSASPRYLAASSTAQQLLMRDSGEGSGESERDWPPPAASVELLSERRSVICDVSPSRRTPERDRRDPQSSTGVPQTVIHPPAQATLKEPVSDTVSPNPVASKEMDRTPGLGLGGGGGGGGGGERGADQPSQKPPSLHHFPHHHSQKASASPNSVPGTPEHKDSRTVQHRARMQQQLHRDEALGALPPGGGRLNSVLVGSGSSSSVGVASNLPYPAPAGRYHHPHPHHHQFYYPSPEAFGLGGELKHHKSLTSASSPQAQQQEQFHHQQQHSLQHPEERGREWAGFRPHRGNASGTLGQKEEEMMMMMMMSSSQPGSAGHGSSGRAGPQQQSDFYDMGVSHQHLHLQNKIWGSQLPSGHPMGDPEILKPGVRSAPKRAVPKNPQDAAPPPQSSRGFTEEMARSRRPPSNGDEGQHPNPLMMRRRVRSFISPIPAKRQHQEALTSPSPAGEGAEAHRAPQIPDNLPQMEPPASREKSGCPDAQQGAPNSGNGIGFVDPCGSASQTNAAPSPAGKTKILPPRKGRGLKLEAIVQKITSPSAKRGVAPPGVATHGAVGLGEAFAAAVAVAGDSNPSGAGISEIFGSSSAAATGGDCDPAGVFGPSLLDRKPSCLGGAAIANAVRTANADAGPSLDEILAFRCGEESFPGAPYPFRLHEGEGGEQEEEEEYEEEEDDEEFERETEKSGRRLGSDLMPLFAAAAPPLPSPALSDIRSFSSCGYNAPEPAGERDQAFPLGRRPEDFTERPPSLFACYGLPGNAVAAPLAGPAAPSGCGSPYPLGVRGGEEGKVEAGVCAPPSLVPKGYFPSGKKKGRPVGSVNKQKRASPQQQGPGGTGSAQQQQQQNQNQNLSQPVPQTQLSNQKPAPVLEAAPPPPPPPSTTFPCPDVDFSTAVPHADPNPSGESFTAPNEGPKPRRRRQRKPAGGEEAEEEEGEQSGVRQRRRRRRRRGGKSAESKPLEEEEEQEPGGGEPQKRGSFMPYVHVERKLPEAGSLCTVVNEEEEAEVQKRPGAFPLAAQPEDQDLSAVVLSSQQPSPSSSSPSSSPGLGKSFPASSYVLPGPVVTESPVLGRLLCCLCGKWANFKNLGDLYGPYYPADYATSLPKNQPQSSRQARPGTGAGGVSVSPSCLKQEPEEESQGSPGKEKVRHKSAEVKPLPSSSLPCSAEEGRTKGEEEEREGEEKQEPPFLPSATNPAAGDGEPVFPAPASSLATAGGSGHRKPTTHPRFKRRHRSNEEPLPLAGSSSSRSQTKPEPETDPLPAPAPAPIPQVPLDGRELWIHEACVVWASGVFLVCGRLYGLQEALEGARETLCSHCQQCGSTLGCYSKGCSLRYHYVCAIDTDCSLNEDNFSMRCPKHKQVKCVRVISSEQSERG